MYMSSIPTEKREAIFQAALTEFATKGYERASTNQIIQQAGISKGLLFHYFGNKKNLFLALFDSCLQTLTEKLLEPIQPLPEDFFERLLVLSRTKLEVYLQHPLEYQLIMIAYEQTPQDILEEITKRVMENQHLNSHILLDSLDQSRFREGIDQDHSIRLIMTALESLGKQYMIQLHSQQDKGILLLPQIFRDVELLIEMFKYGIYRREGEGTP